MSSSPGTSEEPSVEVLMGIKFIEAQNSLVGMVWKLVEWGCNSGEALDTTEVQNYELLYATGIHMQQDSNPRFDYPGHEFMTRLLCSPEE
ncbi:hypothetical protein TNCV_2645891 [Trichonephila clavipes]|nr:hypothetical protein TNCV_2645891 [Trichonephila clavipes]